MQIEIYCNAKGKEPFRDWLDSLKDKTIRWRIEQRMARLELDQRGDYRALGGELFELRMFFGAGYRLYCAEKEKKLIVLLCGGDKSSQTRDIAKARQYWNDYKERFL